MNKKWHILFCDNQLRPCPVTEFIDDCSAKQRVKIFRFLNLLEEHGPILPRPYADVLCDGIHELRIQLSGNPVRILYFFCFEKYIILYYAFVKNTDRVPDKFIRQVISYRDDFLCAVSPGQLERASHAII